MSTDSDVLFLLGNDWRLKVARIVPEAIVYGIYLILMGFLYSMQFRKGFRMRASNAFLIAIATLMFLGATLFLSLDVADLVERMKIVLIQRDESSSLEARLRMADSKLKEIIWTEELLFILMLTMGDSVVVWRTWTICFGLRKWMAIPIATWVGSVIAALFEVGCDIKTNFDLDLSPIAAPLGPPVCIRADVSSFTLSYVTNIFCTALVACQTWEHRRVMSAYLGTSQNKARMEKLLILLIESGFGFIILTTLQAIPVYQGQASTQPFTGAALTFFNVVNAVYQQAMGLYPTVVIVLVKSQRSIWDATQVSEAVMSTFGNSRFAEPSDAFSLTMIPRSAPEAVYEDKDEEKH